MGEEKRVPGLIPSALLWGPRGEKVPIWFSSLSAEYTAGTQYMLNDVRLA